MALSGFNADAIVDDVRTTLQPLLDEGLVKTLSIDHPPGRSEEELVELVRPVQLNALYIVEPEVSVEMGLQTSQSGSINRGFYAIDFPLALLGVFEIPTGEKNPARNVFRPVHKRVLELLTADPHRNRLAIDTIPGDYAHSGRKHGSRLLFAMTFTFPFAWTPFA